MTAKRLYILLATLGLLCIQRGSCIEAAGLVGPTVTVSAPAVSFVGKYLGPNTAFLGIRYATAGRFAPPVRHGYPGLDGPVETTSFGSSCYSRSAGMLGEVPSEDCLHLNVWTPATVFDNATNLLADPGALLPVSVYIHGGAFSDGSGRSQIINPTTFTSKGIVLVSLNYRIGILGFFRHPELTEQQPSHPSNFGLLDQQSALLWLQDNIHAFGGDKKQVTLMGESAGAMSIGHHLVSTLQQKQPYFQRAIMQSPRIIEYMDFNTLEASYFQGDIWAEEFGCPSGKVVECMKQVDPRKLSRSTLWRWSPSYNKKSAAALALPIDDHLHFPDPLMAYKTGKFDKSVDIIIGSALDENTVFTFMSFPVKAPEEELYNYWVKHSFPNHADEIFERYSPERFTSLFNTFAELSNDVRWQCPLRKASWWMSIHSEKPIHRYLWNYQSPSTFKTIGIFHASELPFVWNSPIGAIYPRSFLPEEQDLAHLIGDYWTKFIKGQLTTADWPGYDTQQEAILYFGERTTTKTSLQSERKVDLCNWWNASFPTGMPLIDVDVFAQEPTLNWVLNETFWLGVRNIVALLGVGLVSFLLVLGYIVYRCTRRRSVVSKAKQD